MSATLPGMLSADDGRDLPAGWYPDLSDRVERYWNGSGWTGSRPLRDETAAAETLRSQRRTERNVRRILIALAVVVVWVVIALVLRNATK